MLDEIGDQSFRTRSSTAGLVPVIRHPVVTGSVLRSTGNEFAVIDEEDEEETWSDVSV